MVFSRTLSVWVGAGPRHSAISRNTKGSDMSAILEDADVAPVPQAVALRTLDSRRCRNGRPVAQLRGVSVLVGLTSNIRPCELMMVRRSQLAPPTIAGLRRWAVGLLPE